jgi:hypothetical protein
MIEAFSQLCMRPSSREDWMTKLGNMGAWKRQETLEFERLAKMVHFDRARVEFLLSVVACKTAVAPKGHSQGYEELMKHMDSFLRWNRQRYLTRHRQEQLVSLYIIRC